MIWKTAGIVSVCKWEDRRDALTIINKHSVEIVEMENKRGQVREKHNIVRDYNDGVAGIDRSGQMLSYYSGLQKSVRLYKKIGFHYAEIFVFNAYWLNTKFIKCKLSLLHFRLAMVKYMLSDMVSQSLQSSLSSPNFLKQFTQKEGHKKKYSSYKCRHCSMISQTTNHRESRGFFVMLVLRIQHCALNHVSSCTVTLSKIEFMRVTWLLQNNDLCIMYMIMIHVRSDLTVTKHWFMCNVYCNILILKIYIVLINNTYFEVRCCHNEWKNGSFF